jgi:hypothetical protein
MRKHRIENAAYEVATQVRAVEDSIDVTLTEMAELQSRVIRANSVAHAGFGTANPALTELSAALSSLVEARGAIAACHAELATARGKVPGLRTVAFGDGEDCPPSHAAATLRVVA